ncbi:MAG TPA: thiamine biosynthesis protein [Polyangiaceae bacterium]|nr:thiamine biosynthesis protein [Polyangiaceae bacterium]
MSAGPGGAGRPAAARPGALRRRGARWAVLAAAAAGVVLSCRGGERRVAGLTPPPADLVPSAAVRPGSSLAGVERWQRVLAEPDDPVELDRLATAEGASGLLAGLEEGGAVGLAALRALPRADDAEVALGRLAEILLQAAPPALPPVLDAVEGVALRPLAQRERLDPLGQHAAFDALVVVAKRGDLPKPTRARAVSVARLLAQRAPYDARLLPTEFDPP